ncbi:MAG: phenylacetate--CoA ligase family protein [Proteobacteria bacterium]|nr:phenylacetate--CoA ligase family protein [Pseudomonadota bacterium]MDA1355147.1 phenylacetate--CoA ligase family protein [Pseudomonadota bacterium]
MSEGNTAGEIPTPVSAMAGLAWPAIPESSGNIILSLLFQLEQSQWWTPEKLRAQQYRQAAELLRHARDNVPYYRESLKGIDWQSGDPLDGEIWRRVPLLRREDIQTGDGRALISTRYPKGHGAAQKVSTSGSSGKPVTVLSNAMASMFWNVITLRDFLWRRVDLNAKVAVIRFDENRLAQYPDGLVFDYWLKSVQPFFATGACAMLDISTPVDKQVEWLTRQEAAYLITYPSNLEALLLFCREQKLQLSTLSQVQTVSEVLHPRVRALCQEVWGFDVDDMYTCQEMGYIALQCPDHAHYHVQSENLIVEILDADGNPCAPGEAGRVVLSDLHNFAMPLIRYDIGDFAQFGEPCPCGRGLPVLKNIMGRVRGMLTLADGSRIRPDFGGPHFREVADIRQYQIIQKSREMLEVKLVAPGGLSASEARNLRQMIQSQLGHSFDLEFSFHHDIPRGAGGKFEDFRSEL